MNTVIFDTNLLLDFFVFHNQETSVLWTAAKERKFKTVTCEGAVAELEDVLKRPQFKISAEHPSLADSGKQKALNSLIISEFRAFLNYCLVYMLEHVFNQFRNCLLCCKSYS